MEYSSVSQVLAKAESLKGKKIIDFHDKGINERNKGGIGNIIEESGFGIKNNSEARPDFENLGIELKVLPMKRVGKNRLSVKERTKICVINYKKLVEEEWKRSHARKKLDKILFVFYEYVSNEPLQSKILDFHLFDLENSEEPLIRSDWERTRQLVVDGYAHTLSESQNVVLAASRSGAGKLPESQWPEQPNQKFSERARPRSFSLKPSFTKTLWRELSDKKGLDRIIDIRKYESYAELEAYILAMLNRWEGHTLAEFSQAHGISYKSSKQSDALIIRTALGFSKGTREIKELLQTGLRVKTIPCRESDNYPYEAMSFPFQPLGEIAHEDRFDESEFYTYLQGFIFIPLFRAERKSKAPENIVFGKSFIWRPDHDSLVRIQREWERCRDLIRAGIILKKKKTKNRKGYVMTNNLPGEKDTECIHMRPHARNSDDIDTSLDIGISKQCFWFNKKLIQGLINAFAVRPK